MTPADNPKLPASVLRPRRRQSHLFPKCAYLVVAKMLLDAQADVNAEDRERTPMRFSY